MLKGSPEDGRGFIEGDFMFAEILRAFRRRPFELHRPASVASSEKEKGRGDTEVLRGK